MEESTQQKSINLAPIGRVVNGIEYPSHGEWETIVSEIVIAPQLVEALDGIDGFSHVLIIFYLHQGAGPGCLRQHARAGHQALPQTRGFDRGSHHAGLVASPLGASG